MDRLQELMSKKWVQVGTHIQTDGTDKERVTLATLSRFERECHTTDFEVRDTIGALFAEAPAMYKTLKDFLELMAGENGELENHDSEIHERRAYKLPAAHGADTCAVCAAREIIDRIEHA